MATQHHKAKLIYNYLKLCHEMSTSGLTDVDVDTIIKTFIKSVSAKKHLSQVDFTEQLAVATNALRRKMQIKLHLIAEELENEILEAGNKIQSESQRRYRLSDIQKIYHDFAGRTISRQTLNTHKKSNRQGFIKLPTVHLPNEHTSVLESDLIGYFYTETGIKLDPGEIRKYAYRQKVDTGKGETEKGNY